jgi:voltage-gated potassium channel
MTALLAVGTGFLVTIVDRKDFHTFGAIVTLATVGYGDIVPTTPWGRLIGSVVIVVGVTFLSFLTATVTSLFVSTAQDEKDAAREARRVADREQVLAALGKLDERLDAIEAKLD